MHGQSILKTSNLFISSAWKGLLSEITRAALSGYLSAPSLKDDLYNFQSIASPESSAGTTAKDYSLNSLNLRTF